MGSNLEEVIDHVCDLLIDSPVIHTDETGMKVGKAKFWLHVVSTKNLILYAAFFQKRGREGINSLGVLPSFFGIAVHDFWESYLKSPCKHAYCIAHILRELTRVEEETDQQGVVKMRNLLVQAKKTTKILLKREKRYQLSFSGILMNGTLN
jgi:hypothetical protein